MLTSFNFYNEKRLLNQFSSHLLNPVADFVPVLGTSSNITMVEFGDYQCTFFIYFCIKRISSMFTMITLLFS